MTLLLPTAGKNVVAGGVDTVVIVGGAITANQFDSTGEENVADWFVAAGYTVTRRDQASDNTQVTNSEGFDLAVGVTSVGATYTNQDLTDSNQTPWMSIQITGNMNNIGFADSGAFNTFTGTDVEYVSDAEFSWTGESTGTDVAWTTATGNAMYGPTAALGAGVNIVLEDAASVDPICVVYDVGAGLANSKGTAAVRGGFIGWWANKFDQFDAGGNADQFMDDFIAWLGG